MCTIFIGGLVVLIYMAFVGFTYAICVDNCWAEWKAYLCGLFWWLFWPAYLIYFGCITKDLWR